MIKVTPEQLLNQSNSYKRNPKSIEGFFGKPEQLKCIHLPPGEFELTDALVISEPLLISGEGPEVSTLIYNGDGSAITFSYNESPKRAGIINLKITSNNPKASTSGVCVSQGNMFFMDNVEINGFIYDYGLYLNNNTRNCSIKNTSLLNNELGIEISNTHGCSLKNVVLNNIAGNLLAYDFSNLSWINGENAGSPSSYGIRIQDGYLASFEKINNTLLNANVFAIETSGENNENISIKDCYFNIYNSPKKIIKLENSTNVYLNNCKSNLENETGIEIINSNNLNFDNSFNLENITGDDVNLPKEIPYFNVKDFGAKGDGITDDTNAIKKALDKANGAKVFFPKGTYLIKETIHYEDKQFNILGDGPGNTTLLFENLDNDGYAINLVRENNYDSMMSSIRDLRIRSNDLSGNGIRFYQILNSIIENVHVHNFSNGIGTLLHLSLDNSLNHIYIQGCNIGCYLQDAHDNVFTGARITCYDAYACLLLSDSATMSWFGGAIQGSGMDYAIWARNCDNFSFQGSYLEFRNSSNKNGINKSLFYIYNCANFNISQNRIASETLLPDHENFVPRLNFDIYSTNLGIISGNRQAIEPNQNDIMLKCNNVNGLWVIADFINSRAHLGNTTDLTNSYVSFIGGAYSGSGNNGQQLALGTSQASTNKLLQLGDNDNYEIDGFVSIKNGTGSSASAGSIRLPSGNNNGIFFRTNSGLNAVLAQHDAGNNVQFGFTSNINNMYIDVPTDKSIFVRTGGNNKAEINTNNFRFNNIPIAPSLTTAEALSSTPSSGSIVYINDEINGAGFAYGDGSNWKRIDFSTNISDSVPTINSYQIVLDVTKDLVKLGYPNNATIGTPGGGDAIQYAIDHFINNPNDFTAIYLPPGLYRTTKPLIAGKNADFTTVIMISKLVSFPTSGSHLSAATIRFEGDGSGNEKLLPAYIIQGARAHYYQGICFISYGNIGLKNKLSVNYELLFEDDKSKWIDEGVRTNPSSPQCVVAVDPFIPDYPLNDINNCYPGYEHYYGNKDGYDDGWSNPTGSSQIIWSHCSFSGGYLGVAVSPPGAGPSGLDLVQNAENFLWETCHFVYNTIHICQGQSQSRQNELRSPKMFGSYISIDDQHCGPAGNAGVMPTITGASNIGACRYVFNINTTVQGGHFSNIYFESTLSLGKISYAMSGGILGVKFTGCTFSFFDQNNYAYSVNYPSVAFHLQSFGMSSFERCTFHVNNDIIRIWNGNGILVFRECSFLGTNTNLYNGNVQVGFNNYTQYLELKNTQTYNSIIGAIFQKDPISSFETKTINAGNAVTVVQDETILHQGTFTVSTTTNLEQGALICLSGANALIPATLYDTQYPYGYIGPVGRIKEINDNTVTIEKLPYGFQFDTPVIINRFEWKNT